MKTIVSFIIILFANNLQSQVLMSTNTAIAKIPDPSAMLHIADDKRGVLLPRVALLNNTDNVTVPTPVEGVMVFNTNVSRFNFWSHSRWNKNFEIDDATSVIKLTSNFTGASTTSTTVSGFPATMPLFTLGANTTGWTNLNASTSITITKASNTNYIVAEGMSEIDNSSATAQQYQFAIGVFVNGQLKIVRKYYEQSPDYVCIWKKFNVSGVFYDLPIGTYNIEIRAANLPKITTGYTAVTYGGNSSGCSNITNDMARIFVTAQITQ